MAADGERAQTEQEGGEEQHEDSGLSMVDVLEEERQREEDANAVLGGSDDRNCTYDMVRNRHCAPHREHANPNWP